MERFAVIEDPRRGRVTHDLVEMLVIVTCGVLAKQESFVEIADWVQIKEAGCGASCDWKMVSPRTTR